jgi:hypothetical protein
MTVLSPCPNQFAPPALVAFHLNPQASPESVCPRRLQCPAQRPNRKANRSQVSKMPDPCRSVSPPILMPESPPNPGPDSLPV